MVFSKASRLLISLAVGVLLIGGMFTSYKIWEHLHDNEVRKEHTAQINEVKNQEVFNDIQIINKVNTDLGTGSIVDRVFSSNKRNSSNRQETSSQDTSGNTHANTYSPNIQRVEANSRCWSAKELSTDSLCEQNPIEAREAFSTDILQSEINYILNYNDAEQEK